MKQIGSFQSSKWGNVIALQGNYEGPDGPIAVVLESASGEPLATLSVNMYRPECSHDSSGLPEGCFYVKQWGSNESIAQDALNSGLFIRRGELPCASSGFVTAPVWQIAGSPT